MNISAILLIIALICFIASAVGGSLPRINLQSAGLAFLVASMLF